MRVGSRQIVSRIYLVSCAANLSVDILFACSMASDGKVVMFHAVAAPWLRSVGSMPARVQSFKRLINVWRSILSPSKANIGCGVLVRVSVMA